jgi:hypothetical protein
MCVDMRQGHTSSPQFRSDCGTENYDPALIDATSRTQQVSVNPINAVEAIVAALQLDGPFGVNKIFRACLIAPADFAAIVFAAAVPTNKL